MKTLKWFMLTRKQVIQNDRKMEIKLERKSVPVVPHRRSTPSPVPRKNPNSPKPGPKTVPVRRHKRTPPD